MSTTRPGLFVTFEGIDGSGKTTQLRLLAQRLGELGHEVVVSCEPGGTAIGKQIRKILLDANNQELAPTAELLLYFAARAQNVEELILPSLDAGKIVLVDRFTDSTLAYQAAGRGLGEEVVLQLDRIACRGLKPDVTFLIDIDVETSLARARARNEQTVGEEAGQTRMDEQTVEFHRRVAAAYERLAARAAERFRRIDGRTSVEEVAAQVWSAFSPLLEHVR